MRKLLYATAFVVLLAVSVVLAFARSTSAASETFTFVCQTTSGTQNFTLVKPSPNSAIFTNGTTILVSAIGSSITGGTAQPSAVECTVNGEGPFAFLIIA
jgi:hypothetical protein